MKRIAFLLCFMVLFAQSQNISASWPIKTYEVLDTRIEVQRQSGGLLKLSFFSEPYFEMFLGDAFTRYYVNGIQADNECFIIYGFIGDSQSETYYDGYIMILSTTGEIMKEIRLDFDTLEEVKSMFVLENVPIFHLRSHIEGEQDYLFNRDYFIRFDEHYESYDFITFKEELKRIEVKNNMIYVSHLFHGDYHVAFDHQLEMIYDGVIYGVANYGVYYGEVTITLLNGGNVNQQYHAYKGTYDYPGYYQIMYKNQVISFTIHPLISGVTAHQISNSPISIDINKGQLFLNNDVYLPNTIIKDPGHYELIVEGINGYYQIIPFTITSNLSGVYNEQVYFEEKVITFNGIGYLNNRYIESGHTVDSSGHYTLTIFGENGYQEVHHFQIDLKPQQQSEVKQTLLFLEIGLVSIAFGGLIIFGVKKFYQHKTKAF